jgi:Bacterial extracellular solute-binding proteins, family 5 Middle
MTICNRSPQQAYCTSVVCASIDLHSSPYVRPADVQHNISLVFFSDLRVRQAFALAVDRRTIAEQLYGATGQVTSNILNLPQPFQSPNTRWEFDLDKAAQLLEQAGWKRGSDGVRIKDGRRMQVVFQTSANLILQKTQAIVRKALERIGIEVELKAVPATVFLSSDPGNPDTRWHFYADMQMYSGPPGSDPQSQQLGGAERRALGQRRVRSPLAAGREGAGSRQARRPLHPHERSRDRGCRGHPGGLASRRGCGEPQFTGPGVGSLGFASLESGVLVPGDRMTLAVAHMESCEVKCYADGN